jgi:hypothetical protein
MLSLMVLIKSMVNMLLERNVSVVVHVMIVRPREKCYGLFVGLFLKKSSGYCV